MIKAGVSLWLFLFEENTQVLMNKTIDIGYIQKAHGLKGEVFLKTFDGDSSFLKKGLEIFLDQKQFKISSFRLVTGGVILKLMGVEDRNSSDLLKGKTVCVKDQAFETNGEGFYLNRLMDFGVYLGAERKGKVSGFAQTEAHDLLRVQTDSGEIELPFVDTFIIEIKDLEKEIHVDCPIELFDADFFSGGAKK